MWCSILDGLFAEFQDARGIDSPRVGDVTRSDRLHLRDADRTSLKEAFGFEVCFLHDVAMLEDGYIFGDVLTSNVIEAGGQQTRHLQSFLVSVNCPQAKCFAHAVNLDMIVSRI